MELSVVVPTLNDRERLLSCLDALSTALPERVERVVVNGPSSDGTTGAVRSRDDVDVLVEISERNPNVARNAGIEVATGDVVAFVGDAYVVSPSWYDAVERAIERGADVVTGPLDDGGTGDRNPPRAVTDRPVTRFHSDNVAFDRTILHELDGFDETLAIGGARDCAHRLAGLDVPIAWNEEMRVRSDVEADGGTDPHEADPCGDRYRALGYRLAKNYGLRPTVFARPLGSALRDGVYNARAVLGGDVKPTDWFTNGVAVASNTLRGLKGGLYVRYVSRPSRGNPAGLSSRHDRAVHVYDRR